MKKTKTRRPVFFLRSKKGFTLMEMLIVVAIIAILVAVSIPVFSGAQEDAKIARDAHNIEAFYRAFQVMLIDVPDNITATPGNIHYLPCGCLRGLSDMAIELTKIFGPSEPVCSISGHGSMRYRAPALTSRFYQDKTNTADSNQATAAIAFHFDVASPTGQRSKPVSVSWWNKWDAKAGKLKIWKGTSVN